MPKNAGKSASKSSFRLSFRSRQENRFKNELPPEENEQGSISSLDNGVESLTIVAGGKHAPQEATADVSKFELGITIGKEAIRVLDKIAKIYPPLKVATSIIVAILDRLDKASDAATQLEDFTTRLKGLLAALEDVDIKSNPGLCVRLEILKGTFAQSAPRLQKILDASPVLRFLTAEDTLETIKEELNHITCSIEVFTMRSLIQIELTLSSQLEHYALEEALGGGVIGAHFGTGRPECLEGTRTALLVDLLLWATTIRGSSVQWLTGCPGRGKTTIAETFCALLFSRGALGGSFFCDKRNTQDRRDFRRILPSLARDLANIDVDYRNALLPVLRKVSHVDILGWNPHQQFQTLMVAPFQGLTLEAKTRLSRMTFVIDALDEACDDDMSLHLLDVMVNFSESPDCPLKFFITARSSSRIYNLIPASARFTNLDRLDARNDIHLYITTQLGDLQGAKERFSIWPPLEIDLLVDAAEQVFIHAAAMCKYIRGRNLEHWSRYEEVLRKGPGETGRRTDGKTPSRHPPIVVTGLTRLYDSILQEAFDDLDPEEEQIHVLSCLTLLACCFEPLSVSDYAALLTIPKTHIRQALEGLHSLVMIPDDDDEPIVAHHYTFIEHLTESPGRSPWSIDRRYGHYDLALYCFQILETELHFNVSNISTSHRAVNGLPTTLQSKFQSPSRLTYASFFWAKHWLEAISLPDIDGPDVGGKHPDIDVPGTLMVGSLVWYCTTFLARKFLPWVEVLSALKSLQYASSILIQLQKGTEEAPEFADFRNICKECLLFISRFKPAIEFNPAHTYVSALPLLTPNGSPFIYSNFAPHFQYTLKATYTGDAHEKPIPFYSFYSMRRMVRTICVSPNGKYLASAYHASDKLYLWNLDTGSLWLGPLYGRKGDITSLVFSEDSDFVATGTDAGIIVVWNVESGLIHASSEPSPDVSYVSCLSVSTATGALASGHDNSMVHLWDLKTCIRDEELSYRSQDEVITSLSFSSDGRRVASGSTDMTINVETIGGSDTQSYEHTSGIKSIVYSKDDAYIFFTAEEDEQIHILDSTTMEVIPLWETILDASSIESLALAPDGSLLLTGTHDGRLALWSTDVERLIRANQESDGMDLDESSTSMPIDDEVASQGSSALISDQLTVGKPWKAHSGIINSVAFIPGTQFVVSGSMDFRIHAWDLSTIDQRPGIYLQDDGEERERRFERVLYAPNSEFIVGADNYGGVSVWDADSGVRRIHKFHDMFIGQEPVIALSHDSQLLALGDERTLGVWRVDGLVELVKMEVEEHGGNMTGVQFVPKRDGNAKKGHTEYSILTAACDGKILQWKLHLDAGPMVVGRLELEGTAADIGDDENEEAEEGVTELLGGFDHIGLGNDVEGEEDRGRENAAKRLDEMDTDGSEDMEEEESSSDDTREGETKGRQAPAFIALSSDGSVAAYGSRSRVIVAAPQDGWSTLAEFRTHARNPLLSLALSPNLTSPIVAISSGRIVVDAGRPWNQACVDIWDYRSQTKLHSFGSNDYFCEAVDISPSGMTIAMGYDNHRVLIGRMDKLDEPSVLIGHTGDVRSLAFSPDGRTVVSGSHDCSVRTWEIQRDNEIDEPISYLHSDKVPILRSLDELQTGSHLGDQYFAFPFKKFVEQGYSGWTGWVEDADGNKLFWVPPDTWRALRTPGTSKILGVGQTLEIDIRDMAHGWGWGGCFTPNRDVEEGMTNRME